ncbi:hypothetical protein [Pseudomonas sp. KU43P]|uniref:hypothetical protein n=1 Tax=Pseudomonas sp. KU43P TaxID=2487887 RepID=UPI0012A84B29|nr:hypothetical protein [Pseudomonas sp. KU43P]BBH44314.1 hypothetical protein KU43P_07910 [Pseudomonas sp. KU43P]
MSTTTGAVAFIILAAMAATICASLYVAVKHLERVESLLANCTFVTGNRKTLSQAGLFGKVMRMLSISLALTFPKAYARKGLLDLNEVANFPNRIKKTLILLGAMHPILIGSLIAFRIWLHILDPSHT